MNLVTSNRGPKWYPKSEPIMTSDLEDLRHSIASRPADIHPLVSRRENDERQRWAADELLVLLAESGDLRFPLTRQIGDNPDYYLISDGADIGLEITELVPERLRRAQELNECLRLVANIDESRFDFDNAGEWADDDAIIAYLRRGGTDPADSRGYTSSHLSGLYEAATERVAKKTRALNSHYTRFSLNWLGIYASHAMTTDPRRFLDLFILPSMRPLDLCFDRVFLLLADAYLVELPSKGIRSLRAYL